MLYYPKEWNTLQEAKTRAEVLQFKKGFMTRTIGVYTDMFDLKGYDLFTIESMTAYIQLLIYYETQEHSDNPSIKNVRVQYTHKYWGIFNIVSPIK